MSDTLYCGQHQCEDRKVCYTHQDFDHCWLDGQRSDTGDALVEEVRDFGNGAAAAMAFLDAIPVRPIYERAENRAAAQLAAAAAIPEPLSVTQKAHLARMAAGPGVTEVAARTMAADLVRQDEQRQADAARAVAIDGVLIDRRVAAGMTVLGEDEYERQVAEEAELASLIGQGIAWREDEILPDGQKITMTSYGPGDDRLSEAEALRAVRRQSRLDWIREKRREQALFPPDGPSRIPG